MRLYIKNMVCVRCSLIVKSELEKLGFRSINVSPGEVEIDEPVSGEQQKIMRKAILDLGLEPIEDKDSILIEQVKSEILSLISNPEGLQKSRFSDYISTKLGYSYNHLSTLFSAVHGSSIERFYITNRIERVKEMLIHGRLSFSEIAFRLHYSSVAHMSSQFKKETGLTLTRFRSLEQQNSTAGNLR